MAISDAIIGWKTLPFGCHVMEPGNSAKFRTGDWRSQHPVTDREKCIKCGMCWIFCPDMAYSQTLEGYYEANMEYCKGCGICAHECPKDAITMVPEEG
ncbi:MAG: 4Fe-4S binding protein [Desulfobacteraceae bacterium]|nr:4Fe-4S binding protein [Desulfobacteraceae bacterium]